MVIEQALRMIFGASPLSFSIPEFAHGQVIVGDFFYPFYRIGMLCVAIAAVAGTWLLLNRTAFGKIVKAGINDPDMVRSEEHTSELQSLMRISYAVFCLKKKKQQTEKK